MEVAPTHLGSLPRYRKVTSTQGLFLRVVERVIGQVSGLHRSRCFPEKSGVIRGGESDAKP